jgi:hypothetical protein
LDEFEYSVEHPASLRPLYGSLEKTHVLLGEAGELCALGCKRADYANCGHRLHSNRRELRELFLNRGPD